MHIIEFIIQITILAIVFVQIEKNHFRLTEVELEPTAGELRPVKKGIKEGSLIVVDGSFHLNSQRKRAELE